MVKNHEGNAAVLDKPRVVQLAGTVSMTQAAGPSQEPVMEDDEEGGDGDADVEPRLPVEDRGQRLAAIPRPTIRRPGT